MGDHGTVDGYGYRRIDNVTDEIATTFGNALGGPVSKDDIFYFLYAQLHDPHFRSRYVADLKKMLPHVPPPSTRGKFDELTEAGRKLAKLHIGYESVEPWPLSVQLKPGADPEDRNTWRVEKLKFKSKTDHTAIVYNRMVTISQIPAGAERYMLGSRSALGWIIDRYQIKTDKASGIVNDPNDWADEQDNPRYIVDLIGKVTRVAVDTMEIVDQIADGSEYSPEADESN